MIKRLTQGIPPVKILLSLTLGGAGGLVALWLGLPLAMLLGAMIAMTLSASLGYTPAVPQKLRFFFVPIVGVAIGAGFPPDFFAQASRWWITMLALVAFIPVAHLSGYVFFRRVGRLSKQTAYYASMPGGFIEAIDMGERAGADMPMLIMMQFLRLILCIVLIPIGFSIIEGHAVGSASGISLSAGHADLTAYDAVLLVIIAAVGWFIASRFDLPAAVLSGPLLLSGLAHATGITDAVPPGWSILMTQWVMGTALGCRLVGFARKQAGKALGLVLVNVIVLLTMATLIALVLAAPAGEPMAAVILAFAPGGVSEMSLVALSLHLSAVYVSLHHLVRIVLAVVFARIGARRLQAA